MVCSRCSSIYRQFEKITSLGKNLFSCYTCYVVISVVASPSLRFQGSLLLEVSLFYTIALLYQPLLDRHGTWLIGYRSREAIQFSRNKKEQWYTAPLKRCIIALCNLFRCNIVRWSLKDAVRPGMSFDFYIIPQPNVCVNSETQNIVFVFGYSLWQSQYIVFWLFWYRRRAVPPIHPLDKSHPPKETMIYWRTEHFWMIF